MISVRIVGPRWPGIKATLLMLAFLMASQFQMPARASVQPLEQMRHTRWTNADGAPANIMAIAQTPDGFLWLGTATGLYRFDGIRFERIAPADRDPARSLQITALLTAHNGDLWVGYDYGGVAVYHHGALRNANDRTPRGSVSNIIEDGNGRIWVSSRSAFGPVVRYLDHRRWNWKKPGVEVPNTPIQAIFLSHNGPMLAVTSHAVIRLPASSSARLIPQKTGIGLFPALAEDSDGTAWIADDGGLYRLDGRGGRLKLPPVSRHFIQRKMIFDHDGSLWITGQDAGVIRVDRGTLEHLARGERPAPPTLPLNTLSGDAALSTFQDKEGNIWMGSQGGLDRFAAADVNLVPSIPLLGTRLVQQGRGMPILFAGAAGIYQTGDQPGEVRLVIPLSSVVLNLCNDADARVVILTSSGIVTHSKGREASVKLHATNGEGPSACASDGKGGFWLSANQVYHLMGTKLTLADEPIRSLDAALLMRSPAPGDLLTYRALDSLKFYHAGKLTTLLQGRGIPIGFIKTIVPSGSAWLIGGEHGLARLEGKNVQFLDDHDHPFLANISGILPLSDGSTWIITAQGIVRIPTRNLEAAFSHPTAPISAVMLGQDQGLRARSNEYDLNDIVQDKHGILWFATNHGLAWLDPKRLLRNTLVPTVVIRALTAGGQSVAIKNASATLPAGTHQVSLDYTALSLTDAIANQFRYRLQGVDPEWVTAGTDRQAHYNNLTPGTYRFQVIAANADGVWNNTGATITFTIRPYFYQTWWFSLGLLLLLAIIGTLLVRWRLRETVAQARNRIEARVEERERIARELHDTLLQGLQGLLLRFQAVAEILLPKAPARDMLEEALERGDDIVVESRDRVRNLRQGEAVGDLEDALLRLKDGTVAWKVSGIRKPVCGPVVEEAAAIAKEALGNARKHAGASHLHLEVTYRWSSLTIEVRDDGCGIDPKILQAGGKEGHFGLIGMRERARQLHAKLTISSKLGDGTTVRLRIPGRIAYNVR